MRFLLRINSWGPLKSTWLDPQKGESGYNRSSIPKHPQQKQFSWFECPFFLLPKGPDPKKNTKCFAQLVVGVEPRIMSNLRFDFGPKSRVSEVGWFGRKKPFVTMDVYLWKGAVLLHQAEWNWIREAFHEVMFYRYFENVCISVVLLCILYS